MLQTCLHAWYKPACIHVYAFMCINIYIYQHFISSCLYSAIKPMLSMSVCMYMYLAICVASFPKSQRHWNLGAALLHVYIVAYINDYICAYFVTFVDKLAPLWPFIGICVEVLVLVLIIIIYEKRKSKQNYDEDAKEEGNNQLSASFELSCCWTRMQDFFWGETVFQI